MRIDSKSALVLDLSCKGHRSYGPPAADPLLLLQKTSEHPHLQATAYQDNPYQHQHHQETNNNDKGHVSEYLQPKSESQPQWLPDRKVQSPDDRSSYVLTPPQTDEHSSSPRMHGLTITSEEDEVKAAAQMQVQLQLQAKLSSSYGVPPGVPVSVPGFSTIPAISYASSIFPNFYPSSVGPSGLAPAEYPGSTSPVSGSPDEVKKVPPRPFKAYPRDSLAISLTSELMFDPEVKLSYQSFRNRMLDSVKRTYEGTNMKMRRNSCSSGSGITVSPNYTGGSSKSPGVQPSSSTIDEKDAAYWERRRKNNEAAKRSRDARRAKEDEIAIKAAFLEQECLKHICENKLLKEENARLKEENARLKFMSYGH
ncbi:uncharacterized protein LOC106638198 [Copidosoma floridanum]|uniref:uncharacterized protein LOC106638198 n=1 Tax=Copidosoma floridanum TaxID=29053 RepID=UPI0006C9CA07|nr:uncharacterized protein LOC106638198 [Copidosoma floridanum]XP_014206751.1 uncharacterized protein LOC106638198 [Copidosoma floridanum]